MMQTAGSLSILALLAGGALPRAVQAQHARASATVTIAVSVPLNEYPDLPEGIEYGAMVAAAEANAANVVPGVTFKVSVLDDTINNKHDPVKEASNARKFIADSTVIGEDGPLNSGAAQGAMAVYNQAQMAQISPANTLVDLTNPKYRAKYEPLAASGKGVITYFRTIAPDRFQAAEDMEFAFKTLHVKRIYVVDNQGSYGVGLANDVKYSAKQLGMTVVGYAELDPTQPKMGADAVAKNIASQSGGKLDMVFFGGEFGPTGGATFLADALKANGVHATFMGGDGIKDDHFITQSTNGGVLGSFASKGGPDVPSYPPAAQFMAAEKKMFPKFTISIYDIFAYDAANVLIKAYAAAVKAGTIKAGQPMTAATRAAICKLVAQSNFGGASGPIAFDANGDVKTPAFSIYKVVGSGSSAHFSFVTLAPSAPSNILGS
jgi:branched-chain amino acid transport system substrate-binding protein